MSKDLETHFSNKELVFFDEIKPYLRQDDAVLKIGNGFGYLSTYISKYVRSMKIFEVNIFEKTVNKDMVTLYDGKVLPVEDKSFDVAIFNLVFHHIPNNHDFLRQTISKTRRHVILYEQTYDNILQKIQLVWRDWYVNIKAGTPSKIYWGSYLKRNKLDDFVNDLGVSIEYRTTKKSHLYFKELVVLKIDD